MVDKTARRELAFHLRHLANGCITDDEFDDQSDDLAAYSADAGLYAVRLEASWKFYDDFTETRFRGEQRLSKQQRHEIARWILFLQNDLEFEWRDEPLRRKLQRFLAARCRWISTPEPFHQGEKEVWPFFRRTDYESALSRPQFLCGAKWGG